MARGQLPKFSLEGYRRTATTVQRSEERKMAEYRAGREWKTAVYVEQGAVPMAMVPTLNWVTLDRMELKSDLQFERLFPGEKARQAIAHDVHGELIAQKNYLKWLRVMKEDPAVEAATRQQFHEELYKEVSTDNDDVFKDWDHLMYEASLGSIWEFENLVQILEK